MLLRSGPYQIKSKQFSIPEKTHPRLTQESGKEDPSQEWTIISCIKENRTIWILASTSVKTNWKRSPKLTEISIRNSTHKRVYTQALTWINLTNLYKPSKIGFPSPKSRKEAAYRETVPRRAFIRASRRRESSRKRKKGPKLKSKLKTYIKLMLKNSISSRFYSTRTITEFIDRLSITTEKIISNRIVFDVMEFISDQEKSQEGFQYRARRKSSKMLI